MKISILTATYNRINLLSRLYESIVDNYKGYKDVEWIVVDDGSNDDTRKVVNKWIKEAKFNIIYMYQDNGGKMSAINNGMQYVNGEIVIEIDSDDYLLPNVLSNINSDYETIMDNDNVYGVVYRRNIGESKEADVFDKQILSLYDLHNRYNYDLEMTITFKTKIRKKFQYILEDGEKFSTEARMYYKIDFEYEGIKYIDCEIVSGNYEEDGYSRNIEEIFRKYPKGYYNFFNECLSYVGDNTLMSKRLYFVKHYILFSYLTGKGMRECVDKALGCKLLVTLLVIPGYWKSKKF